jgi:hypothetical protein
MDPFTLFVVVIDGPGIVAVYDGFLPQYDALIDEIVGQDACPHLIYLCSVRCQIGKQTDQDIDQNDQKG